MGRQHDDVGSTLSQCRVEPGRGLQHVVELEIARRGRHRRVMSSEPGNADPNALGVDDGVAHDVRQRRSVGPLEVRGVHGEFCLRHALGEDLRSEVELVTSRYEHVEVHHVEEVDHVRAVIEARHQ